MKEHQCKHCGRRFETSDALRQHISDKHSRSAEEHKPRKRSMKKIGIYAVLVLILVGIGYGIFSVVSSPQSRIGPVGSTHTHQDVKMYVNGEQIDFTLPKYQRRARHTHFEGGDGDVNHKHATGVTIYDLFKPLGIELAKDCLTMDDGTKYCNSGDKTLKIYVNGRLTDNVLYDLQDLDKILISYGSESQDQIQLQLNSITSKAAKESGIEMELENI